MAFVIEKGVEANMAKVRQDAWSSEDDLLLAETVLRHVREGSTQLNAFEEVGDELNRTSAACGFRWNAEVRKKYDQAMELAKRQRKEKKRAEESHSSRPTKPVTVMQDEYESDTQPIQTTNSTMTMEHVIHFLKDIEKNVQSSNHSNFSLEQTRKENKLLHEHIQELERKLEKTEQHLQTVQEDYQAFIQIMERARKMTVLDDQGSLKSPSFKMDKNGNLEQIVQNFNQ